MFFTGSGSWTFSLRLREIFFHQLFFLIYIKKFLWGISSFFKNHKAQWEPQHPSGLIHAVIHHLLNINCNQSMRHSRWLMKLMVSCWLTLSEAVWFIYIYPATILMNHRSQLHCFYMLNKNVLLTVQPGTVRDGCFYYPPLREEQPGYLKSSKLVSFLLPTNLFLATVLEDSLLN